MLYGTKRQRGDWSFRLMLYGGLNILSSKFKQCLLCYDVVPNFFICIISDPTGSTTKRIPWSEKEVSIIGNYSILTTHLPT